MDTSQPESKTPIFFIEFSDYSRQGTSAWDMVCTDAAGIEPLLNETICREMASYVKQCNTILDACRDYPISEICELAELYCSEKLAEPFYETGRCVYDGTPNLA
jgi:hypothetical protein